MFRLPASERRYGDILINDGAEEGTRISNGRESIQFSMSWGFGGCHAHSTFEVELVNAQRGLRWKRLRKQVS